MSVYQIPTDFNFRIHERNGWFGPMTKFDGKSGFIRLISTENELNSLLSDKRKNPEVLMISDALLNEKTIDLINSKYHPSTSLLGIFVYTTNTSDSSVASKFPNKQQSAYSSDFVWNPYGNGEQYFKYDYPIFYPPKHVSDQLLQYIERDGDRAGIYINLVMKGRGNAEFCLKFYGDSDHMCDPIGGTSLYGSFDDKMSGNAAVWLISSMDAFGIAPYGQVGADYSISGFVASLAALDSLKELNWEDAQKTLRFAFFDAEEIGYTGSQRFLAEIDGKFQCKDIQKDETKNVTYCNDPERENLDFMNIKMSEIDSVIEIKSVGLHSSDTEIYAHTQKTDSEKDFVTQINETLPNSENDLKLQFSDDSLPGIPPSSTHSFLRLKNDLRHIVLCGHKAEYINQNIGKLSDNVYDSEYITKAATLTARTLASLCFGDKISTQELNEIEANFTLVDGLMYGLVNAPNDSVVIRDLFPNSILATDHVSLYCGVYYGLYYSFKHLLVENILKDTIQTNLTDTNCTYDVNCSDIYGVDWKCSRDGFCEKSLIRGHPAYSLALEYNKETKKYYVSNTSEELPLYAETQWTKSDIKYVLLPSLMAGRLSIGIGILMWTILSIVCIRLWRYNIELLKK